MKYFEVFAGVGGFGLGLPKDWKCVGFSEIDKYASMVLKYHYPEIKNYGDCTKIQWKQIPNFDLLTGGSPCQDFSIAGKRRGLGGSRSSLAWEFIRCLRDKQPRYFIWENVKGVMSSRGGWDFANLISAFSESGYSLWWQVLNAKDFGVPQNRERVFVVGFRDGSPKEVFFERQNEKNGFKGNKIEQGGEVMATLSTRSAGGGNARGNYINVLNRASQHYRLYDESGLAPTLQSQSGMSSQKHPFVISSTQKHSVIKVNESTSLTSAMGEGGGHIPMVNGVRKLMPIECERLMSFPNNWTKWGENEKGEKIEISDSQRYKMCGNGVVSNVVREIVNNLITKD